MRIPLLGFQPWNDMAMRIRMNTNGRFEVIM